MTPSDFARSAYPLALNPELCYNFGMDTINKMLTGAGGRLTHYLITTSNSLSFTSLGSRPRLFFWSTL